MRALHPKNKELGEVKLALGKTLYIEQADASLLTLNEKITLLRLGNCLVKDITITKSKSLKENLENLNQETKLTENEKDEELIESIDVEYLADDKDFKGTKKMHWLSDYLGIKKSYLHE